MVSVLRELASYSGQFDVHNIISWQHDDLLAPLLELFEVTVHNELGVRRERHTLNELLARLLDELTPALEKISPDIVLVQGDTATADQFTEITADQKPL